MENWNQGGAYEHYVGRWSRLVAAEFIRWLAVPEDRSWLDLGCGTGALSQTIMGSANPVSLTGVDSSAGYIAYVRRQLTDPRAEFLVGDAMDLPGKDDQFDVVVSGLMLNFLPDPARGLSEMTRVAKPGGIVALYVWDYAGKMQFMRHFWDAAARIDPECSLLDEARRFPICHPDRLSIALLEQNLTTVSTHAIDVPTEFASFDDLWAPFLGGQGSAPGYLATLPDSQQIGIRDEMRRSLPIEADGSIRLIARAWAAQGRKPEV